MVNTKTGNDELVSTVTGQLVTKCSHATRQFVTR